jgi:hypothetical protein
MDLEWTKTKEEDEEGNETLSRARMNLKFHCTMVFRTVFEALLHDQMGLKARYVLKLSA